MTFALSWTSPAGGPPTDIDLVLERLARTAPGASWPSRTTASPTGKPPAERITGYLPPADGTFRLRAIQRLGAAAGGEPDPVLAGDPPGRHLRLGGGQRATPGDAAGAVAVGAVDWRGDRFKAYSSQGPTADGRLKPDIVAPTDTRLMGPNGSRSIGGTSIAAPNAAGVAAVLLAAARRAGQAPSAAEVRGQLSALRARPRRPGTGRGLRRRPRARVGGPAPPGPADARAARLGARSRHRALHGAVALDGHPLVAGRRRPAGGPAAAALPPRDHHQHAPPLRGLPHDPRGRAGLPRKRGRPGVGGEGGQHAAGARRPGDGLPPPPRSRRRPPAEDGRHAGVGPRPRLHRLARGEGRPAGPRRALAVGALVGVRPGALRQVPSGSSAAAATPRSCG